MKKKSQAVTALWLNAIGIGLLTLLCSFAGMVAYSYYRDCDPIKSKQVEKQDQLIPLFVMQLLGDYPGMPGLFVAGVFSGALSTVSSGLNAMAGVCITDLLQLGCGVSISEERKMLATKILALLIGVVSFAIIFVVKFLPGVLVAAIAIFGIVGGPILGAFSLGMFVPFTSSIGVLAGMIVSLAFTLWMGFGSIVSAQFGTYDAARFSPRIPSVTSISMCPSNWNLNSTVSPTEEDSTGFLHLGLYDISSMWYAPISTFLCIIVGILCSLLKPQNHRTLNHRLISPNCSTLFFWLPARLKRRVKNYYDQVGSDNRGADSDLKSSGPFKKNGAINVAYLPSENTDM